jgi:hypothetical protein
VFSLFCFFRTHGAATAVRTLRDEERYSHLAERLAAAAGVALPVEMQAPPQVPQPRHRAAHDAQAPPPRDGPPPAAAQRAADGPPSPPSPPPPLAPRAPPARVAVPPRRPPLTGVKASTRAASG